MAASYGAAIGTIRATGESVSPGSTLGRTVSLGPLHSVRSRRGGSFYIAAIIQLAAMSSIYSWGLTPTTCQTWRKRDAPLPERITELQSSMQPLFWKFASRQTVNAASLVASGYRSHSSAISVAAKPGAIFWPANEHSRREPGEPGRNSGGADRLCRAGALVPGAGVPTLGGGQEAPAADSGSRDGEDARSARHLAGASGPEAVVRGVDAAGIHWTGGVGMFALLERQMLTGVLLVALAQLAYWLLSRRRP